MLRSEASLWKWLSKADIARTRLHMNRVENKTSSGMPDVEGCYNGAQFWIELKIIQRPVKQYAKIRVTHLRPKQIEWLHNRWLVGGNAWILLRVESIVRPINRAFYLIPGKFAKELYEEGLTEAFMNNNCGMMPLDPSPKDVIEATLR